MKKSGFHICISVCLLLFFLAAAVLTFQSHRNYLASCIPVETLKNTTSESLRISKSCYAKCSLQTDGTFTFQWNDAEVYENIGKGDRLSVDVGNRILPAEITNRYEIDGARTFTARMDGWIGDLFQEQPSVFTITASYNGPRRAYVIPASCVMYRDGNYMAALAVATPKAWGTAYKVRYEPLAIHEINEEKCAVRGLPTGGEIICSSDGRLWDGANILVLE